MEERRKYIRIDLCTEVEYEILPMQAPQLKGETKNISAGGICLLTDREITPHTVLRLNFFIPDKERTRIECLGRVIWQKKVDYGYLTGIEFKNLGPHLELKLNIFVLSFLKEIENYESL
jgi:c-di-GMP-binding flagellar brake protein YcgR